MTISRVLPLVIGQNDINAKLLQPIVALICKVMAVKEPCVKLFLLRFKKKIKRVNDFSIGNQIFCCYKLEQCTLILFFAISKNRLLVK